MFMVHASYNAETKRWTASSDDIPGLVVESDNFEEMDIMVRELAPELMALNNLGGSDSTVQILANKYFTIPVASIV